MTLLRHALRLCVWMDLRQRSQDCIPVSLPGDLFANAKINREQAERLAKADAEIENLRNEHELVTRQKAEAEDEVRLLATAFAQIQTIMTQIAPIIEARTDPNEAPTCGSTAGQTPGNSPERPGEAATSTNLDKSAVKRERPNEPDGRSQADDGVERTEDAERSAIPNFGAKSPENTGPEHVGPMDKGPRGAEESPGPSEPDPAAGAQILIELDATEADALLRIAQDRGYPDLRHLATHLLRATLEKETARRSASAKRIGKAGASQR